MPVISTGKQDTLHGLF